MSELSIRPYVPADYGDLVDLWTRCGLRVSYNDPDRDIALWRASPNAEIFVGETGGEIAASVCIGHDGHRGYPYYVAVDPAARGKDHGRKIMRHAEAWLTRRGVPKINLMVRETNDGVRAFYRAIGYEDTPRHVMARWLTKDGQPPSGPVQAAATLSVTIISLEMTARPSHAPVPIPARRKLALLRAQEPGVAFYRYLYDRVGEKNLWYERRAMDDESLSAIVNDPGIEIYVLYADGVPAGYAELDRRQGADIELAYFGMLPEFTGQGLGAYLLGSAIDIAWTYEPSRLWLHTCTLDHPKALPLYQKFGFIPFKRQDETIPDPRLHGLIP